MLHIRRYNEGIVQPTTMGNQYNQEIQDILKHSQGRRYNISPRVPLSILRHRASTTYATHTSRTRATAIQRYDQDYTHRCNTRH